jgi:hypothetical protein
MSQTPCKKVPGLLEVYKNAEETAILLLHFSDICTLISTSDTGQGCEQETAMNTTVDALVPELQRVLWAYFEAWKEDPRPESERDVCFTWAVSRHRERFGTEFGQSGIRQLVELGYLEPGESSRRSHRRYYRIPSPERVAAVLTDL